MTIALSIAGAAAPSETPGHSQSTHPGPTASHTRHRKTATSPLRLKTPTRHAAAQKARSGLSI